MLNKEIEDNGDISFVSVSDPKTTLPRPASCLLAPGGWAALQYRVRRNEILPVSAGVSCWDVGRGGCWGL